MEYASVWRRLGAYLVDVIPILCLVLLVFVLFFDFGETYAKYSSSPGNIEARVNFLIERNRIRDISFLLWVIYGALLEGTVLQGTLGKKALGITVVDESGRRISTGRSIARNMAKIVSLIPLGLGFIWALFSKERKTWHDMIAKTRVIITTADSMISDSH